MEYNIDILVAGCNTNCRHCYVNGGPNKRMTTEDFEICIDLLLPVFLHFGERVSFTLDNEPYNHPDFPRIIDYVRQYCWNSYFHHGSTTGIAFNHRVDKDAIWEKQKAYGIDFASVTLHGGEKNHNFITRNTKAFSEAIDYIRFVKAHHGKLCISLMLSKLLIQDCDEISEILHKIQPDEVYLAIPNSAPSKRMQAYQKYRPTYEECLQLSGYLSAWGLDEAALMKQFEAGSSKNLLATLKTQKAFKIAQPEQCYLTIHPDLNLYIGNSGVETEFIGNLHAATSGIIIDAMENAPANYNFFPVCFAEVPKFEDVIEFAHSDDNLVYPDMDSFITYYAMHKSSTRIHKKRTPQK